MTERDVDKIQDEAGQWWSRRHEGGAELRAAFAQWLDQDARHGDAYDRLDQAWRVFDVGATADPVEDDIRAPRNDSVVINMKPRYEMSRRRVGAMMAGALAASLAGIGVWWAVAGRAQRIEFTTGTGERTTQTLADGSKLEMDANSHVLVVLTSKMRRMTLNKGRVLFDVAKDETRPFVVETLDAAVTALGTLFWVEYRDLETTVGLVRGKVRTRTLGALGHDTDLMPGDLLTVAQGGQSSLSRGMDVDRTLAWRTGRLVFENENLARVAERMNDYSDEKIDIGDARTGAMHISGSFIAGHNHAFLTALKDYYHVSVSEEGGRQIIRSAVESGSH